MRTYVQTKRNKVLDFFLAQEMSHTSHLDKGVVCPETQYNSQSSSITQWYRNPNNGTMIALMLLSGLEM